MFLFVRSSGDWEGLEAAILGACATADEWPAQVAAAIYAGVDHAIEHLGVAEALDLEASTGAPSLSRYESVIAKLTGYLRSRAPMDQRLPVSTDEALVAGMVGLVGDHLRMGRLERLRELRPDLVLLTLLPYVGFSEAQRWASLRT
jgi:hypothetical protein